jgi:hypothetical protein
MKLFTEDVVMVSNKAHPLYRQFLVVTKVNSDCVKAEIFEDGQLTVHDFSENDLVQVGVARPIYPDESEDE